MKTIHRVAVDVTPVIRSRLAEAGVHVAEGYTSFHIDDADERWPVVSELVRQFDMSESIRTRFTRKELREAEFLQMDPIWLHGYPQSDDDFGYLNLTYDLSDTCQTCSIGLVQAAPFRMSREPRWGTRSILMMNWVFDAWFVRPETWDEIFRPFGIECREVLRHKTGRPLESVVQLVTKELCPSELQVPPEHKFEVCPDCWRMKYHPWTAGPFPPFTGPKPEGPIALTKEWWGSGGVAFRETIVRADLYRRIEESGMRGASFVPVAAG